MKEKTNYISPKININQVESDVITYSETEEWVGPEIGAEQSPKTGIEN